MTKVEAIKKITRNDRGVFSIEKRQFGQFFTTNSDYILQGLEKFVKDKEVVDPFAGNQDLINWSRKNNCKKASGFDCDKKYIDKKDVFYRDSINCLSKYKFICSNPPYLHKNKADQKIKERFFSGIYSNFEDLYQVSIFSILDCREGILIVPLNFLCAENSQKIRNIFFDKFEIVELNIFSGQVFEDTTYNVISFYFKKPRIEPLIVSDHHRQSLFPDNPNQPFYIFHRMTQRFFYKKMHAFPGKFKSNGNMKYRRCQNKCRIICIFKRNFQVFIEMSDFKSAPDKISPLSFRLHNIYIFITHLIQISNMSSPDAAGSDDQYFHKFLPTAFSKLETI